jgi:hypothetical protein
MAVVATKRYERWIFENAAYSYDFSVVIIHTYQNLINRK